MDETLRTNIARGDDEVTLRLRGALDMAAEKVAEDALQQTEALGAPRIVLDLYGVEFIDSTGVRFLLNARKRSEAQGYELRVRFLDNRPVRRLLDINGLTDLFTPAGS